jgi:uncharacterized tellurite resistance protein B-like protein
MLVHALFQQHSRPHRSHPTVQRHDDAAASKPRMLKTLKDLFDSLVTAPAALAPARAAHQLELSTAVLLVEVMRADAHISAAERASVVAALTDKFALSADESERLVELAHDTARRATDFFSFTSRINDAFTMEQKIRMVEHMWRVAYADGVLSAHENHVMRRIADLLYVPHGAYVSAKMRARDAGATPDPAHDFPTSS